MCHLNQKRRSHLNWVKARWHETNTPLNCWLAIIVMRVPASSFSSLLREPWSSSLLPTFFSPSTPLLYLLPISVPFASLLLSQAHWFTQTVTVKEWITAHHQSLKHHQSLSFWLVFAICSRLWWSNWRSLRASSFAVASCLKQESHQREVYFAGQFFAASLHSWQNHAASQRNSAVLSTSPGE